MASVLQVGEKWRAQIRRKGKSIAKTFKTKREAEAWARLTEGEVERGDFTGHGDLSRVTLAQALDRYAEEVGSLKPFGRSKLFSLKLLKKELGHLTLDKITDSVVIDFARKRHAGGAGAVTVTIDISYLGTFFNVAKKLWKLPIITNPVTEAREMLEYLGLTGRSQERDRRPTQQEIDAICEYFLHKKKQIIPMWDVIKFAVATAMRASEITSLRWDDMDIENRTVIIRDRKDPKNKIGNNQTVPLLKVGDLDAFEIAMRQLRRSDKIFPYNSKSFSSLFPRACDELDIIDLQFHDLRHEGVSRLFEAGYRIEQVALVSGHKNWRQLARYTQVKAKDLHRSS